METTPVRTEFRVADSKLSWLQEKLAKLSKRAVKLGVPAPTIVVGAKEIEVVKDSASGRPTGQVRIWWACKLVGEEVKLNGWCLLATLQNLEGEVVLRAVPGKTIPVAYHNANPQNCDHCKVDRKRNDTFIVQHDDGRTAQVGRQCLKDFLGHPSPEILGFAAEFMASMMDAMGEAESESEGGGRSSKYFELETFMGYVVCSVRQHGWVPRSQREFGGNPTADHAMACGMFPSPYLKEECKLNPTQADAERAVAAVEWAAALEDPATLASDFLHNVRAIARVGVVDYRTTGMAAAIIRAYDKELEVRKVTKLLKPVAERGFVGEVGKRATFEFTLMSTPRLIEGSMFSSVLHEFACEGNKVVWFGSSTLEGVSVGQTFKVLATPKKHDLYTPRHEGAQAQRQTTVTRVTLHVEKAPKARKTKTAEVQA